MLPSRRSLARSVVAGKDGKDRKDGKDGKAMDAP